ncbi:mechanosensitive ion channel family protein [Galbibacter mesophilus]|uniref:mechanosensitive ion channel family protein n=1 Tax=Galbibacter mesophilus TaxID=379069 RepID=UPI00191D7E4C|nr:mechanosensitive ion channel family protein [Galbibacter mesophilus]MCM5663226.1 mechanosensitive ion channel family protein [Galbibacter mesophilus]
MDQLKDQLSEAWGKMIKELGSWLDAIVVNLPNLLLAIIVFVGAFFLSGYINTLVYRVLGRTSMQSSVKRILAKIVSVVVVLAGLFIALGILNLSKLLTSLLAGAGVVGLAIGLALQGTLANTFSGIVLSFVKYVQIGDWVKSNGYRGRVVDIDLRMVTIRQPDNNMVFLPNRMVVENPLENFSTNPTAKVFLSCGVGYSSDLDLVEETVLTTLKSNFDTIKSDDDLIFYYTEFADSSINFEVRFTVNSESNLELLKAKGQAIVAIKKAFDKKGINIPFPIRTIDFTNKLTMERSNGAQENQSETEE